MFNNSSLIHYELLQLNSDSQLERYVKVIKSACEPSEGRFMYLDFRWTMQGGLKMLSIRLDLIESARIISPVVDSSCRKSICARRDSVLIKSSCKVPHTSRVKFVAPF